MSSNSAIIVQEVYEEFESMLHYVQHSESETAYAAERNIFKRLLKLGHSLMVLFFVLQAERCPRTAIETKTGDVLPYHSEKKRDLLLDLWEAGGVATLFLQAGCRQCEPPG